MRTKDIMARSTVSALALIAAWAATAPAMAQEVSQLDELVVTAERREVNLQNTAISASVLTPSDLAKKGVNNVDGLQFTTPSLNIQNTGQNVLINLRGVGKSEGGIQAPSGILIYRDGVSASPGGFMAGEPYYDLAGVEVLRGPQGTLAGANATGGAIFIRSADPKLGSFGGWAEGQVGNYDDVRFRGALNIPLSETLAVRVAANLERRNSFYDIAGPWTGNPGNLREADARVSLLWEPNDAFRLVWKNDYVFIDHGGSPAGPKGRPTSQLFDLTADAHLKGMEEGYRSVLQLSYEFPSGLTLNSIAGYQYGRTRYDLDYDGTWIGAPGGAGPLIYTVNGSDRTVSEEINLVSPSEGPLTWLVGAVYQHDLVRIPSRGFIQSAAPGGTPTSGQALQVGYRTPKESWGVFGQVSYDLTEKLQLQVGARYSDAKMTLDDEVLLTLNGVVLINHPLKGLKQSDNRLTGKVSLNYELEDGLIYGFVATGHKSGGINPIAALAAPVGTAPPYFDPEHVVDYEIGWKQTHLDGRLRTQVNAYRYDYDKFQISIFDPASALGQLRNVSGKSTIQGVEAQAQGKIGDFAFDLGVSWLDSKVGTFSAADSRRPAAGVQNLSGREMPNAAPWSVSFGAQYVFQVNDQDTLTPRVDYGMIDSRWATLFQLPGIDQLQSRELVNAQLIYERHDDWTVTLYATNLFDERYVSSLSMGNLAVAGAPRQFGLRVHKAF